MGLSILITAAIVVLNAVLGRFLDRIPLPKKPSKRTTWVAVVVVGTLLIGLTAMNEHISSDGQAASKISTTTPGHTPLHQKIDNSGGWGPERPTFTDEKPSSYAVLNSITDNPNWGDERGFIACRDTSEDGPYTGSLIARNNDLYTCEVAAYNDIGDALETEGPSAALHNVRLIVNLPDKSIYNPGVQATLTADDSETIWATCNFVAAQPMRLLYQYGSARMYTNGTPKGGLRLPEDVRDQTMYSGLLVSPGVPLGYRTFDGVVRHSYQYSVYVTFTFRIELDPGR